MEPFNILQHVEGGDDSAPEALKGLSIMPDECSELIRRGLDAPCAPASVVAVVAKFVGKKEPGPDAVRAAAEKLGCTSERCVVAHKEFRKYALLSGLTSSTLDSTLATHFKPKGPATGNALLSNVDIDGKLKVWAKEFRHWACPYAMIDFETTDSPLNEVNFEEVAANADTFSCVVNTDVSTGRGKHWVALFVDLRSKKEPWTVEYFNSAGNSPPRPITRWLEKTRMELDRIRGPGKPRTKTVVATKVKHQTSRTECGVYALYFIRRRLEDPNSLDAFFGRRISDSVMETFRQYLFAT